MHTKTRSSALSFDSGPPIDSIYAKQEDEKQIRFDQVGSADPEKPLASGPAFLNRNKTERGRLQGLTRAMSRTDTDHSNDGVAKEASNVAHRVKIWMVNEGESFSRI